MALEPGDYLHDGTQLWCFQMFLLDQEGAVLEECWANRMITVSLEQFAAMGLTKVERDARPVG